MPENLKVLFEGVEGLSEDFHVKLETLFEAKVADRVESEIAQLKEAAETSLAQDRQALKEASEQYAAYVKDELAEQVSKIVSEVSSKWLEENKMAIVAESKVEMAESVLTMIQSIFESNGLKIAPDQAAILEAKEAELLEAHVKLAELEGQLQEAADKQFAAEKAALFESALEGLADTQKEKAIRIVESFGDEDIDSIKVRLDAVRSLVEGKTETTEVVESQEVESTETSSLNESLETQSVDNTMELIYKHFKK